MAFTSGKETLEKLLPLLRATLADRMIRFTGEHVRLSVKQSTSLALIVNELVLNTIKYGKAGIEITFQTAEGRIVLEICDEGSGFAEGFDPLVHSHTDLKFVQSLVAHDLEGVLKFENRPEGGARMFRFLDDEWRQQNNRSL